MHAMMSLTSYLSALLAGSVFWIGLSQKSFLLRALAAGIAAFGIWAAEKAERRSRTAATHHAAMLNGVLLIGMAMISLYLHFTT